jgi:hypothetical protein
MHIELTPGDARRWQHHWNRGSDSECQEPEQRAYALPKVGRRWRLEWGAVVLQGFSLVDCYALVNCLVGRAYASTVATACGKFAGSGAADSGDDILNFTAAALRVRQAVP